MKQEGVLLRTIGGEGERPRRFRLVRHAPIAALRGLITSSALA
jgi:hypothetical protein